MPLENEHAQDPESLLRTGVRAACAGQQYRARDLLRRVVALDPQNASAWLWLSGVEPDLDSRRHCLERVLALDPANEAGQRGLAEVSGQQAGDLILRGHDAAQGGERLLAQSLFERAVKLDPDRADGWLWLSGFCQDLEERRTLLERVLALDPSSEMARQGLSLVRLKIGAQLVHEGAAAIQEGDTARGEELLRRATEEDPENVQAWLSLSEVAASPAEKETLLEEVLRLDAGNAHARNQLSHLRRERANQLFDDAISVRQAGEDDEARSLLAEVVALDPVNAMAWLRLSEVIPGEESQRDCLGRALALDPANSEALAVRVLLDARMASGEGGAPRWPAASAAVRPAGRAVMRRPESAPWARASNGRFLSIAGFVLVAIGLLSAGPDVADYARSRLSLSVRAAPAALRDAVGAVAGTSSPQGSHNLSAVAASQEESLVDQPAPTQPVSAFPTWQPDPSATPKVPGANCPTWQPDPTARTGPAPPATPEQALTPRPNSAPLPTPTPQAAPTLAPTETQASPEPSPAPTTVMTPSRIVIPSAGIDGQVVAASLELVQGSDPPEYAWVVPEAPTAGWHNTSAPLGIVGNTVINGHNWPQNGIFKDLYTIEEGALIVLYSGEKTFAYTVVEAIIIQEAGQSVDVQQANARRLMPTDDERVTIITCHPYGGTRDRLIVTAVPAAGDEGAGELLNGALRH